MIYILLVNPIAFVFQGQIKSHTVFLESSFSNTLKIADIKLHPPDERFTYVQPENNITELFPNRKTKVSMAFLSLFSVI